MRSLEIEPSIITLIVQTPLAGVLWGEIAELISTNTTITCFYSYENLTKSFSLIPDAFKNNKRSNITKFHLIREFKRYTGQTVFTYINILKCKKAQSCLMDGLTVTETATECGFDNVSYFSQVYKKIMGVSPNKTKK